ncbi:hypothetical protein GCM10011579_006920 [Streptomyces albiflavescens]|uniref:Uncharacterized protein n=1 Tax=Streptomyces albiflavescens TaxID=1623582 RepID=A0A918CZ05_9ACTN|nr:hypothetical protein GCM10011579_006920 [Streptomyces albiflavescens]
MKARAAGTGEGYADPLQPTAADLGPWAEEAARQAEVIARCRRASSRSKWLPTDAAVLGVHRHQADLGAEAEHRKHEGQPHPAQAAYTNAVARTNDRASARKNPACRSRRSASGTSAKAGPGQASPETTVRAWATHTGATSAARPG